MGTRLRVYSRTQQEHSRERGCRCAMRLQHSMNAGVFTNSGSGGGFENCVDAG